MNTKQYKRFFSYVIPSVLAFALSGIYTIIDGFLSETVSGISVCLQSILHIPLFRFCRHWGLE